jgi:hypothetical protein
VSWECGGEPEVFLRGTEPENQCGEYERSDAWGSVRGAISALGERAAQELMERLQERAEELARRFAERR